MKLYATITSERASKGQGGNNYLHIAIYIENREHPIGYVEVELHPGNEWTLKWRSQTEELLFLAQGKLKGKQQKGECDVPNCTNQAIRVGEYNTEHDRICLEHSL